VVVLAGGAGERFWPRSRRERPKPFLRVLGGESLLQGTLRRARKLAPPDRIWIVSGREHARAVRAEARIAASRHLVEPQRRNTAMAVALAARRIALLDPDAVLVVLPADHCIPDAAAFAAAIRRAAAAASDAQVLVTLGVRPTRPETGYGYIQLGPAAGPAHPGLHRVARFVEKPEASRAERFVREGDYLWNAGIFVWTARTILEEIEAHAPELARAAALLRVGRGGGFTPASVAAAYAAAPSLPVDVAVLERSRRVWTLPVDFHWSDVGTWASLAQELGVAPGENRLVGGQAILHGADGNLVWGDGRLVVLLGVQGLAVIDSEDALLVARLDGSAEVRRVVERLRAEGREQLT
jgi:mannose-1-phosphate guanylyltransferase/mannose-6-phosphate isomerase